MIIGNIIKFLLFFFFYFFLSHLQRNMGPDQYTHTKKMGTLPTKQEAEGHADWKDAEHRMGVSSFF